MVTTASEAIPAENPGTPVSPGTYPRPRPLGSRPSYETNRTSRFGSEVAPTGTSPRTHRSPRGVPVDPTLWVTELLAAIGSARVGKKWQCPAHAAAGEHAVSLAVSRGSDGRALLYCHAGCSYSAILQSLRLPGTATRVAPPTPPKLHAHQHLRKVRFPSPRSVTSDGSGWIAVSIDKHPYGVPAFAWKVRERNAAGAKRIYWESANPRGEVVPGLLERRQADFPLYREREIGMAIATGEIVVLVESESSVDALNKVGIYATTWAGGASDPPVARISAVLGEHSAAVLIPDHDSAGLDCRDRIVRCGAIPEQRVVLGNAGEDARDLLKRLGTEALRTMLERTI